MRLSLFSALALVPLFSAACGPRLATQSSEGEQPSIRDTRMLPSVELQQAIRAWAQRAGEDPLKLIELTPVPGAPDVVLARCDVIPGWDGFFAVYGIRGGRVEWQARCDREPDGAFIRQVRAITLKGFVDPVIEVYDETHCGNGSLRLYLLRGRTLAQLFATRAVDDNDSDSLVLENGVLFSEYRDLDGNGHDDVILSGVLRGEGWAAAGSGADDKNADLSSATPCREEFRWDSAQGKYVQNERHRAGFVGGWK
ncbi:MAG: hypothetical protein IT452_19160 [Planctomycetia bacterium]|nr:hypothetical protein [Planctomycetia bacterium]